MRNEPCVLEYRNAIGSPVIVRSTISIAGGLPAPAMVASGAESVNKRGDTPLARRLGLLLHCLVEFAFRERFMDQAIPIRRSRDFDSRYAIAAPDDHDGEMPRAHEVEDGCRVPEDAVCQLERDGVVCLRGLLDEECVDRLREEADHAVANPSPHARFVNPAGDSKIFYYEFNLWRRYPGFRATTFDSHLPDAGATLMRSQGVTLYYTSTFVKDGGAPGKVTPWHEDRSYSRFMGRNVVNINVSFDAMPAETTLKFKLGSHLRDDPVYVGPTFEPGVEYDKWMDDQRPMPPQDEIDRRFRTVYWSVSPGDALVFFQSTLHAGPGNSLPTRRHSTAFNLAGDGVGYDAREGFIDSPDVDPSLPHRAPPAGRVFPKLR